MVKSVGSPWVAPFWRKLPQFEMENILLDHGTRACNKETHEKAKGKAILVLRKTGIFFCQRTSDPLAIVFLCGDVTHHSGAALYRLCSYSLQPVNHHETPHYATSRHVTPRHVTPHDVTPHHAKPHHTTPHHVTPRHVTSRHVMPRHTSSRHATPPHSTSRHFTPRHAAPLHVTPRHGRHVTTQRPPHCETRLSVMRMEQS